MLIKTLATVVKKKLAKKSVFFPKSYKTFRNKTTKIVFFDVFPNFFFPNGLKMCLSTKLAKAKVRAYSESSRRADHKYFDVAAAYKYNSMPISISILICINMFILINTILAYRLRTKSLKI
jgi:hypothetical protein